VTWRDGGHIVRGKRFSANVRLSSLRNADIMLIDERIFMLLYEQ
jgi:hypothetical protein